MSFRFTFNGWTSTVHRHTLVFITWLAAFILLRLEETYILINIIVHKDLVLKCSQGMVQLGRCPQTQWDALSCALPTACCLSSKEGRDGCRSPRYLRTMAIKSRSVKLQSGDLEYLRWETASVHKCHWNASGNWKPPVRRLIAMGLAQWQSTSPGSNPW